MLVAVLAGVVPLGELAELVNIGTLAAFLLVSIGVIVLRRTRPDLPRAFRVPLMPVLPILSALACLWLMLNLPGDTWIRFLVWMALGLRHLLRLRTPQEPVQHAGGPGGRRRRERRPPRLSRSPARGESRRRGLQPTPRTRRR